LALGAESRPPGLIGDNGKPVSRLESVGVVSEARMYDRYWTQATTMPAKASMVARQPKMMVKVSSLSMELADILEVGLSWDESSWYELGWYEMGWCELGMSCLIAVLRP
jgi:hypothetical protein